MFWWALREAKATSAGLYKLYNCITTCVHVCVCVVTTTDGAEVFRYELVQTSQRLFTTWDQTHEPAVESGDSEHLKRQNPPWENAAPSPSEAPLKSASPSARQPACRRRLVLRRSSPYTFMTLLPYPVKNHLGRFQNQSAFGVYRLLKFPLRRGGEKGLLLIVRIKNHSRHNQDSKTEVPLWYKWGVVPSEKPGHSAVLMF